PISSYSFYRANLYHHSFPTRRSSDLGITPYHSSFTFFMFKTEAVRAIGPPQGTIFIIAALKASNKSNRYRFIFKALYSGNNAGRSEEHTSELQSRFDLVCRLLLERKK